MENSELRDYVRTQIKQNPAFDKLSGSTFNYLAQFVQDKMLEVLTFQNVHDMVMEEIGDY